MKRIFIVCMILCVMSNLHGLVQLTERDNVLQLSMVYGSVTIDEPVLIELIKSPAFQRLKHIRQYGVLCHAQQEQEYTRYQHSLGVFFLTKQYGAPLEEQVAALLHDVSHTVFSHVGDIFFNSDYYSGKDSYQDNIHEWYLEHSGIMAILQKYGCAQACSAAAKTNQRCFEQPLPGLCADRIEYNLTGGLLTGCWNKEDISDLLTTLHFKDGEWFFDNLASAKKFASVALCLCEQRWGSAWVAFIDYSAAQALKRACELGIINPDDIHFSTDDIVWQKLVESDDAVIAKYINSVRNSRISYCLCTEQECDLYLKSKFSGTDPWVAGQNGLKHLTELAPDYKGEFERVKHLIKQGWSLRVLPA
jgi:HD superfamily phosphohydrolase